MFRILLYSFVFVSLSGCVNNYTIDPEQIASSIIVTYELSDQISFGNRADVVLTNETEYCVIFPLLNGLSIYSEQNGNQINIKNLIDIIGDQNLILPPNGEPLSTRRIALRPDTSSLKAEVPFEFIVEIKGYLCDDKKIQIVKKIPFTAIP